MTLPRGRLAVRLGLIGAWAAVLFWLSVEDQSNTNPILLAALVSLLFALRSFQRFQSASLAVSAGTGLAAGLMIGPLAAGLMVFKSGVHGHPVPDFSIDDVVFALGRTPFFMAGGLLIGAGLHRFFLSR